MPHLSPMNWLMAISSFWLILFFLSSIQWWTQPAAFHSKPTKSLKSLNQWKW